jgi:hypothetical protein
VNPAGDAARVRDFLGRGGADHRGRTLKELLGWPDARLESEHDFIQWLFPLDTPSPVNPLAPVPSRADFAALARDAAVREGSRAAFARMLAFYGLRRDDAAGRVAKAATWSGKDWAQHATHNDLRLTRILRSLTLLGLRDEAGALLAALEELVLEGRGAQRAQVPLAHWREAVH